MKLFGFQLGKKEEDKFTQDIPGNIEATQQSFVPPDTYDGTVTVESGGFFSTVYDFGGSIRDENTQLSQYRSMALYPEVDMAIEDIINESIVFDDSNMAVHLDLSNVDNLSLPIKDKIHKEFKSILKLLKFNHHGYDIFRKWYIDARLYFHLIIDDNRPEKGLQEIR